MGDEETSSRSTTTRHPSRRSVLLASAGGCAALGVGTVGLGMPGPAPGAHLLSAAELEIVASIAVVLFPAGIFPLDGVEAGVPREVDRLLAQMLEPLHASGFRGLLHSLEWGTLASRGERFTRLPAADRLQILETWSEPSIFVRRVALESFRVLLGMAYFSCPEVLGHIGWRATCGGGPS